MQKVRVDPNISKLKKQITKNCRYVRQIEVLLASHSQFSYKFRAKLVIVRVQLFSLQLESERIEESLTVAVI